MDKLFLLDAYALIYRAYYALIKNPRINSKGFNTSAVLGFVNTLEDVLKKEKPTHIGVAFDPSGPTFRHEAYEQYKAQREETPEVIRLSVPIIKDIIHAYRIPILEVPGYEADDVIGTLATQAGKQGITTYMMTPDKDYGQLVGSNVFMYRPRYGDKDFDVLGVEEVKEKLLTLQYIREELAKTDKNKPTTLKENNDSSNTFSHKSNILLTEYVLVHSYNEQG